MCTFFTSNQKKSQYQMIRLMKLQKYMYNHLILNSALPTIKWLYENHFEFCARIALDMFVEILIAGELEAV